MRMLLDTHIFLWAVTDSPRLSPAARTRILQAQAVHVSSASLWEIAIKTSLGKLDADLSQLLAVLGPSGFTELPVSAAHAARVRDLPFHHRDPFDRLLVAQALHEPLLLLTADAQLAPYSDLVLCLP